MVLKYWVFWIPCNAHGNIKIKLSESAESTIKSTIGDNLTTHNVKVRINRSSCVEKSTIVVDSVNADTNEKASLSLKYVDRSRNGLLIYSHEALDSGASEELQFIDNNLHFGIYHLIKGLFHEHRYHDKDIYVFKAYPALSYPDIRQKDNQALKHYFEAYLDRFASTCHKLTDNYKAIENTVDPEQRWIRYQMFYEDCLNIFGEEIYYHTLLNSQYNASCRTTLSPDMVCKIDYDLHRIAIETDNVLQELHLLHTKIGFKTYQEVAKLSFDHQSSIHKDIRTLDTNVQEVNRVQKRLELSQKRSDRLSRHSLWIGYAGAIFGAIGIYLTLLHPNLFPPRQEQKIDKMIEVQQSQGNRINMMEKEILLEYRNKFDSLSRQVKLLNTSVQRQSTLRSTQQQKATTHPQQ